MLGNIFLPVVEAIRPVSSIAWVPLSIVWFGFGFTSKVFLVGLAVFLVVIVYAVDGCEAHSRRLVAHRDDARDERQAAVLEPDPAGHVGGSADRRARVR